MNALDALERYLLSQRELAISLQTALTAIPALGPENGGQGEAAKAAFVEAWLAERGPIAIERCDSPDPRVESGSRPNLVAIIPGKSDRKLWLFGHLDVVPPGNLSQWTSDPWQARLCGDFIYGRGVEDNQQAVCSMLLLAAGLQSCQIVPELGLGLVFMADEELGSKHGLEWILKTRADLFHKDDLFIVPDGGFPDASLIEISEKAQLWLRFAVKGRQCHASTPDEGLNSFIAASSLALALNGLNARFNERDPLFEPPRSTFTPTKHDANVDAINILPGNDVFYMDCRLLPSLPLARVEKACREICAGVAAATGADISASVEHSGPASAISPESDVVKAMESAIAAVYGVKARPCGIGGATVAALLRFAGFPAAVWSCIANTCHQPNERSSLTATLKDAAVFAHILMRSPGA